MSPLRALRGRSRTMQAVIVAAAVVSLASWGVIGWLFWDRTSATSRQQTEQKSATILLGHAICHAFAVFERAVQRPGETAEQRERARVFFDQFYAPIDEALTKLGDGTCTRGHP